MNYNMENLEEKKLGLIIWKLRKSLSPTSWQKLQVAIVTRENYQKEFYRTRYFLCKNY